MARSWDDVPSTVRADVRHQADGELSRVELVDRPEGGYSVIVHLEPTGPEPAATAKAMGDDDPAMREVVERTRPVRLHR